MAAVTAPPSRLAFAQRLNTERLIRHLSIRALARLAEVPTATVQGWLNGAHAPAPAMRANFLRLVTLLDLAEAVPDDLWSDNLGPATSVRSLADAGTAEAGLG